MACVKGGEGRDEVWRGVVAEVRRSGADGPAAGFEQVEQAAHIQLRRDQDPHAGSGDRTDVVRRRDAPGARRVVGLDRDRAAGEAPQLECLLGAEPDEDAVILGEDDQRVRR